MEQEKGMVNRAGAARRGGVLRDLLLVGALVLLDQATKRAAEKALAGGRSIVLIPGVLEFSFVRNRGAAFGILQNARPFFFFITFAALFVIGYALSRLPRDRHYLPARLCLLLIASGAAGNFIDRAALSYVRDFIYFSLINFPVFNVADIYITCAAFAIVLLMVFYYREEDDFSFFY